MLSDIEKGKKIKLIISAMKYKARSENKSFDEGNLFISLAYSTDKQIEKIYNKLYL